MPSWVTLRPLYCSRFPVVGGGGMGREQHWPWWVRRDRVRTCCHQWGVGVGQGTRKRWELSEAHKAGTAGHLQCHLVVPTALQEALVFPCFR